MRLLRWDDQNGPSLTMDLVDNIPPYAILSHTWGPDDEEVTFHEVENRLGNRKAGYRKLEFCARQASRDNIDHIWVDTCCINKDNFTELQTAITSMFGWYRNAVKCYVYLTDVLYRECDNSVPPQHTWEYYFRTSRWFTRGWTLQELLAPTSVEFFSREGQRLGDKKSLDQVLYEITGIPITALQGSLLNRFSVNERLQWAAKRQTKRKEDEAYCLQGIFNLFIPIMYGEGDFAFVRLREEIDKRSGEAFTGVTRPGTGLTAAGTSALPSPASPVHTHWIVTRSANPLFTGRESHIQELEGLVRNALRIASDHDQCRIAIWGLGGQGKSEICLQLAYRLRQSFWGVFWVDVSTTTLAETSFVDLVQRLDRKAETWEDARIALANLEYPWLLILDNADDPDVDYQQYFPSSSLAVVILTSRNEECHQYGTTRSIKLEGLSDKEARELLLGAAKLRKHEHTILDENVKAVTCILYFHPLALIQAGTFISRGHCTLAQYPRMYERQRRKLLQFQPSQARSRNGSVYATFEVSAVKLAKSGTEVAQDALQLLPLLAVCGPYRLPLDVFKAGWKGAKLISPAIDDEAEDQDVELLAPWHVAYLPPLLDITTSVWDPFRLNEAVSLLESFSLVSTDFHHGSRNVSMHPLAHAWAQDRQDSIEQHRHWLQMGCVMALAHRQKTLLLLRGRQLQSHVEALTTWKASTMFGEESPVLIAQILVRCGWYLYGRRAYTKLTTLLETIFLRARLGQPKIDRAWTGLYALAARNHVKRAEFNEAIALLEPMFQEQSLAADSPERRTLQYMLAKAYLRTKQTERAVALMEMLVEGEKRSLAVDDPDRPAMRHEIASAYRTDGQWDKAGLLLVNAVEIPEQSTEQSMEDDPYRRLSQHALAIAYRAVEELGKQMEKATPLYMTAIEARKQSAKDPPARLVSQRALVIAYRESEHLEEAVALLEDVARIQRQPLAEDDPDRRLSQSALAIVYRVDGRLREAVALLEKVVKFRKHLRTEDHLY